MTRGRWLALAVVTAALLVGARLLASAVVEYRWFAAFGAGAASVWRARAVSLLLLRGTAAALGAAFVYANLLGVVSTVETVVWPRRVGGLEIAERVPAARLRWVSAGAAVGLGLLLALPLDGWTAVDALLSGRTLGELEPYTGRDLAFFVHWLPVENAVYAWALLTLVVTAALVLALYALTPGLRWAHGRPRVSGRVRRHLTLFGVGVLLLLAWGHRLDAYGLLTAGSGEAGAFSGVDQLGAMPARFALAAFTALASLVVLRAGWAGQLHVAFWAVTAVVGSALVVRTLTPLVTAHAADSRVLAAADGAAAANRALYTQRAYGVDRIQPAPAGYGLTPAAVAAGAVSAWDVPALVRAVTGARRTIADGEVGFQPTPTGLAAVLVEHALVRDAAGPPRLEDDADRTVLTLDATRGDLAGRPVPLGDAALSDAGRRVRLLVQPGAAGSLPVPVGRGVVGDRLDDWRVRLAHALAGRDLRLAFSAGTDGDVLLDRRDVRERVGALAPFFAQGRSATPLVALDSVWYAIALYSASDRYPLAQHYTVDGADWASFRHAATALVNAQSGAVRLVPARALDADARAWVRRFPQLFTSADALPGELARALPPATDGALLQAYAFAQFGSRGDRVPVARRGPPSDGADTALAGSGRPAIALPPFDSAAGNGGTAPTAAPTVVGWTLPLLSTADRIEGVLVALGGAAGGTLWLPAGPASPRWQEVLDALADAEPVMPEPGAPGGSGAAADSARSPAPVDDRRGHLRAVPVAGALAYARPEYRVGRDDAPALARVVGQAGGRVQVGGTVAAALGIGVEATPASGALTPPDRLARARALYLDSREALRRGDWAAVGRALDALGSTLGAAARAARTP